MLLSGLLFFIIALFFVLAAWQGWFFFAKPAGFQITFPGKKVAEKPAFYKLADQAGPIEKKMMQMLGDSDFLLQWYRPVSLAGKIPAEKSQTALLLDQVHYGQYLLEQGRKKAFLGWWNKLEQDWPRQAEYLAWQNPPVAAEAGDQIGHVAANLALVRLLSQSLTLWPDNGRLDRLAEISQLLWHDLASQGVTEQLEVPAITQVPDLAATPTPKAPGQEQLLVLDVLPLAALDLFALQALASFDDKWQTVYDTYLTIVEAAYLDDQLPLFAYAYDPASNSYLPFAGSAAFVDTESALLIMLHLAECGRAPDRSIAWIRDQFYNESAIYVSYHAVQGTAADQEESVLAYALLARLARIIEDQALYEAAVQRLLWHQLTNPASEAQSLIFTQQTDGSALVYTYDNVWALLALN